MYAYDYKLYSPNDALSETRLFGPAKIAALKPKHLVFLDEGYCFYIDTDDIVRYKKVRRVVTVDLENFSIKRIRVPEIESTDTTSNMVFANVNSVFFGDDFSAYYYNESSSSYTFTSNISSENQLVIPYVKQDN